MTVLSVKKCHSISGNSSTKTCRKMCFFCSFERDKQHKKSGGQYMTPYEKWRKNMIVVTTPHCIKIHAPAQKTPKMWYVPPPKKLRCAPHKVDLKFSKVSHSKITCRVVDCFMLLFLCKFASVAYYRV